jgi:hypothetical protein
MVRDERSASRLTAAVVIAAIVGAALGVVVQRFVLRDTHGAHLGGLGGAVFGAVLVAALAATRAKQAEEAARTAPVNVPWPLTVDLARRAFRGPDGGLAWKRADMQAVVAALLERNQAITEGEVWFVKPDGKSFVATLRDVYDRECSWTWSLEREPEEGWKSFVARCAEEARENIASWPETRDIPEGFEGQPHYHLIWKGERGRTEFGRKATGAAPG